MNHQIKKSAVVLVVMVCIFLQYAYPAIADDAKAREIMQKVEDRDDGDNQTSEMEMILIDKFNQKRIRKIAAFTKDKGEDNRRLMFFLHPKDVKDTAFLVYDYDEADKDDDQWLYLPALRKTKRIASSDKSSSFMGSDLNYSDMTSRDLEDYDFFLKKEMAVNGKKTWMIESIPRNKNVINETGYKKSWLFVRQDNYVIIRSVRWVNEGDYLKYLDVKKLEQIDGIWISTEMHITKKQGKKMVHKTILKNNNVKFNQNLNENLFTIRKMEQGL
jgi:hypothetical protein